MNTDLLSEIDTKLLYVDLRTARSGRTLWRMSDRGARGAGRRRWTNSPWQMHHLALFAGKPAALRARCHRPALANHEPSRHTACDYFGGNNSSDPLWMSNERCGAAWRCRRFGNITISAWRPFVVDFCSLWMIYTGKCHETSMCIMAKASCDYF